MSTTIEELALSGSRKAVSESKDKLERNIFKLNNLPNDILVSLSFMLTPIELFQLLKCGRHYKKTLDVIAKRIYAKFLQIQSMYPQSVINLISLKKLFGAFFRNLEGDQRGRYFFDIKNFSESSIMFGEANDEQNYVALLLESEYISLDNQAFSKLGTLVLKVPKDTTIPFLIKIYIKIAGLEQVYTIPNDWGLEHEAQKQIKKLVSAREDEESKIKQERSEILNQFLMHTKPVRIIEEYCSTMSSRVDSKHVDWMQDTLYIVDDDNPALPPKETITRMSVGISQLPRCLK